MIDIVMQLGSKTAVVNGETVELLQAPQAKNGVTQVPLRFVAEALGCKVDYDAKTKGIHISKGALK